MHGAGEAVQRLGMEAEILGQVLVATRRGLRRFLGAAAGGRLVESQAEARGEPFGRRQGVAALALVGAVGGQLQQVVETLPLGLCELG